MHVSCEHDNIMYCRCSSQSNILHYLADAKFIPVGNIRIILKCLFEHDRMGFISALSGVDNRENTPLQIALSFGWVQKEVIGALFDYLVIASSYSNESIRKTFAQIITNQNVLGLNLIHLAFKYNKEMVRPMLELIESNTDLLEIVLSSLDKHGCSLVHYALHTDKHLDIIIPLMYRACAGKTIFTTCSSGVNPIHYMLANFREEYFEWLELALESCTVQDLCIEDNNGNTILHALVASATQHKSLQNIAQKLTRKAYDTLTVSNIVVTSMFRPPNPYNFSNYEGNTLLHAICALGDIETIAYILPRIPELKLAKNTVGKTPLNYLTQDIQDALEVALALIDLDAQRAVCNPNSSVSVIRHSPDSVVEHIINENKPNG